MKLSDDLANALLDAAPDGLVIVDPSGVMVFANARVEEDFGYAREELLGKAVEVLLPERFRTIHPAQRRAFFGSPQPRPMGAELNLYAVRKNGEEFPVEISLNQVQTSDGVLVSSAIRDITRRRATELALLEARNEADRANRAKSAFLAAASHDLREPLQTLTLLNGALSEIAPLGSKAADIAASAATALGSMAALLNTLLDISKLEAGAVKPNVDDCSISEIFARLQAQFALQAEAKGLRLIVEHCDEIVRTDPTLLEQIVRNLMANAIRYTEQGFVQLRCLHEHTVVRIEVADTGIGIPSVELESIFEEFYQGEGTTGERREGLGLGLAIVRRVAALLEHTVTVDSEPPRGSRFVVEVPRVAGQRRSSSSELVRRTACAQGGTVMIIDDDDVVAKATSMFLDAVGLETVIVSSIVAARRQLTVSDAPDLLICDYHLADGVSGLAAINAVRDAAGRDIPAILMTGDTSMEVREAAQRIDGCHVLIKPIETDEFLMHIRRIFH